MVCDHICNSNGRVIVPLAAWVPERVPYFRLDAPQIHTCGRVHWHLVLRGNYPGIVRLDAIGLLFYKIEIDKVV